MNPVQRPLNALRWEGVREAGLRWRHGHGMRASVRLGYDGHVHVLGNADGTWRLRLELEQLGAGEMVGIGSVWSALNAPHDGLTADVILSGRVDARGIARIVLTPIAAESLATVSLVVQLFDGRSDVQDPIISSVLEVHGLPI